MILVNDLEELFDSKNVEGIAAKLLAMQQSLKLLVNIADYEDRKLQLAELKNRLEAIASPSVVLAFTTSNTGIFSNCYFMPEHVNFFTSCNVPSSRLLIQIFPWIET